MIVTVQTMAIAGCGCGCGCVVLVCDAGSKNGIGSSKGAEATCMLNDT